MLTNKDYFDTKNELFFQFLNDTFLINKAKTWEDVSKNVTIEKIKRTYKIFAELFPRRINYLNELEKSRTLFTSIHCGTIRGNRIIDEIVRFSLYSDQIIVFHPLQNPAVTNQKIDPRKNPKYWLIDFLDALYFYIVIQKWVRSGVVKLIINPTEYDIELRDDIDKKIEERVAKTNFEEEYKTTGKEFALYNLAEQFAITYKNKSKGFIVKSLLEITTPIFSQVQAEDMADRIIEAFPRVNPLFNKLGVPLSQKMLTPTKGGGPLESMLLIAEKTEGNIYTPSKMFWNQIKEFGTDDFWVKANHLYSNISLNFLNNVDTNFALELRNENRLSGVRQELKKVFSELNNITINNLSEKKIRELQEGFLEEVKKAEAEWIEIKKQADISRKYWSAAHLGIPLIANEVTLLPIALSSIAGFIKIKSVEKQKEKLQRVKNPVSVFVDLKNQKQGYFSELKNCIF
jgi:hypothetical protein